MSKNSKNSKNSVPEMTQIQVSKMFQRNLDTLKMSLQNESEASKALK